MNLMPQLVSRLFATLNLISPGVCVTFALRAATPQTLCSQTASLGTTAARWFIDAYDALFPGGTSVERPLFARDPGAGAIVNTPDRGAARLADARLGRPGGHGITGLRERLAALGGTPAIHHATGGIRVTAVIPLAANEAISSRAAA